jgi:HEAT repeat protein
VQADLHRFTNSMTAQFRLGVMGTNAWPAVPALLTRLNDPDSITSTRAAFLLSSVFAQNDPRVAQYLSSGADMHNAVKTLHELLAFSPKSPPPTYAMVGITEPRYFALSCLSHCGAAADPAVPGIIFLVENSKDDYLRATAIAALGSLGSSAKPALPNLHAVVEQKDGALCYRDIRAAAVEAIGRIAPDDPQTAEFMKGLLQDHFNPVRVKAAISLWRMKIHSPGIFPVLDDALNDRLTSARMAALKAIAEMGSDAASLKPKVEEQRNDPDETVRQAAALALEKMGH